MRLLKRSTRGALERSDPGLATNLEREELPVVDPDSSAERAETIRKIAGFRFTQAEFERMVARTAPEAVSNRERRRREAQSQRLAAKRAKFALDPLWKIDSAGRKVRRYRPPMSARNSIRGEVYVRDNFQCQDCGHQFPIVAEYDGKSPVNDPHGRTLTLDHIVPYAQGGEFVAENLRALCEPCNVRRGTKPIGGSSE